MSATEPITGARVCPDPDCQGFGAWRGDRDGEKLVVHCTGAGCTRTWTAPDRSAEGGDR